MRVLITGITGFVGGYLAVALSADPTLNLFGVARSPRRLLPELQTRVTCFQGDLTSADFVTDMLVQAKPDMLYHLAGQASEPEAWSNPWPTFQVNVLSQLNLIQGLLNLNLTPRILSVTSSKVYGAVPVEMMPIPEDTPLRPDSPYGVSKAAQDLVAQQYFLSHQLPIIRVRPFNHIGPRQFATFVTAAFAQQIARVEAGLSVPVIRVGNLSVQRDFTDVRDVVQAYRLLMAQGQFGEVYNVGSGRAIPVQTILDILLSLSHAQIDVEPDPVRMRPIDQPISYGDIRKIKQATGWQPRIPLRESLVDILNYWRAQIELG